MDKNRFMSKLRRSLNWRLPTDEAEDILADYEEFFSQGNADGMDEREICSRLGDPGMIAKELVLELRKGSGAAVISAEYGRRAALTALSVLAGLIFVYATDPTGMFRIGIAATAAWRVAATIAFSLAFWFALIGTPKSSRKAVARMGGQEADKRRLILCHAVLFGIPALIIGLFSLFLFPYGSDVVSPWLEKLAPNLGFIFSNIMFVITAFGVFISSYAAYGLRLRYADFFCVLPHAAGVGVFINAMCLFLSSLSDPATMRMQMLLTLVPYAVGVAMAFLSSLLIKRLAGRAK